MQAFSFVVNVKEKENTLHFSCKYLEDLVDEKKKSTRALCDKVGWLKWRATTRVFLQGEMVKNFVRQKGPVGWSGGLKS